MEEWQLIHLFDKEGSRTTERKKVYFPLAVYFTI